MKTTFRFPGSAEYSYAEVVTSDGGVGDNYRELCDVDARFLTKVGEVLQQGCAMIALSPLNPVVVDEPEPQWADPAASPQWASQPPQEAQGYSPTPQAYNQPQNAYQAPQQGYQNQAPAQAPTPPGQNAPVCQFHNRPAEFKPAGTSTRTGKAYDAFWACAQRDNNCTKASRFPRP